MELAAGARSDRLVSRLCWARAGPSRWNRLLPSSTKSNGAHWSGMMPRFPFCSPRAMHCTHGSALRSAARDPRAALAGAISRHQAPPETSLRASLLPRAPISEISPPARRRTGLTAACCACRAACRASALSECGLAKLVVRVAYSPRWAYIWPMISALMLLRAGAHLPPAAGRLREA